MYILAPHWAERVGRAIPGGVWVRVGVHLFPGHTTLSVRVRANTSLVPYKQKV